MFAVFEWTNAKKRGFFARRRVKKRGVYPEIERRYAGLVPYFALRVERGAPLNFDYLKTAAGREAGRILMPDDVYLPPGCPVGRYDPENYRVMLLFSGVGSVLTLAKLPAGRVKVGLYDPPGRCAGAALRLLRHAESVRIVSARESVYARYSKLALEMYGAEFIYGDTPEILRGCRVLLAPFGTAGLSWSGSCLVFSGLPDGASYTVDGDCVTLPAPYETCLPPGIDRLAFAGALHGCARVPELGALTPRCFARAGKKIQLKSIARELSPLDNPDPNHYNVSIIQTIGRG